MWDIIVAAVCLLWFLYYQYTSVYNYWRNKGFPFLEGKFPWGNLGDMAFFRRFQGYVTQDMYNKLAPHAFGGLYLLRTPQLLLRDPEIIKLIMTKDFSHFKDRIRDFNGEKEPVSNHLFNLRGDNWRATRVKLTPTFTSGKLKNMYSLFETCAAQFDKILRAEAEKGGVVDIKDFMARFTTDTITTCAFGLDIRSTDNPDNEILKFGKAMFSTHRREVISRVFIYNILPFFQRLYSFRNISESFSKAVTEIVTSTVEYREKNNVSRKDFLQLMIELKNKGIIESQLGDEDQHLKHGLEGAASSKPLKMDMNFVVAQSVVFLLAGLETSSSVSSYCLYELALNKDLQNRLREEIDLVSEKHGGINYQAIQEMAFLDQCVSETMRKYPTIPVLTRFCTKPYRIPQTDLVIEEGVRILIPVYALHHDPEYFPDPEKFDPDRFSPERKSSIKQYTYMPFGEGPRLCIGMRFGLLQTKMGICTVLSKYELSPTSDTQIPLNFVGTNIISFVKGQIQLGIKNRTD